MREHNWLLSVVCDLSAYAEGQKIPGMIEGLQHVLQEYATEAELSAPERAALLERLPNYNRKRVNI